MKILILSLLITLTVFLHSFESSAPPGENQPHQPHIQPVPPTGQIVQDPPPGNLYYEDDYGVSRELQAGTDFFVYDNYYMARVIQGIALPLLNDAKSVVFQERGNPENQKYVGWNGASAFRIPGPVEVLRARIQFFIITGINFRNTVNLFHQRNSRSRRN